jgi:hypothetical protein
LGANSGKPFELSLRTMRTFYSTLQYSNHM